MSKLCGLCTAIDDVTNQVTRETHVVNGNWWYYCAYACWTFNYTKKNL